MAFRQSSFAGGEIAPSLYARSDLPRYESSLRTCRNFIITPQGGALTRPGTEYIGSTKDNGQARLVPFVYSDDVTYVLEFTNLLLRFYKNGVLVDSEGDPYEVVTPYTTADLPHLKWAQVGDVVTLTCKGHAPADLTHVEDNQWTLAAFSFDLVQPQWGDFPPYLDRPLPDDTDGIHPAEYWVWLVTEVVQHKQTGAVFETAPYTINVSRDYPSDTSTTNALPAKIPVYVDKPVGVVWYTAFSPLVGFSDAGGDYFIKGFRIYRGKAGTANTYDDPTAKGIFGYVGEVDAVTQFFTDKGDDPDYAQPPPRGRNPFNVYDETGTLLETQHPNALTFFEQRLAFGGATKWPGRVWFSKTGDYTDFDTFRRPVVVPDSSVEIDLAAMRLEEVRSLIGLDRLFVLTSGGVWTLSDIAADSVPIAKKQTDEGASWLNPIITADTLIYVRSKALGVNEMSFDLERSKFAVNDLSVFAPHLLEGDTIVDWAYSHDPYRIVWAVRSDGALLSMTYHRPLEVLAWAHHDSRVDENGGLIDSFESVCCVPEGNEDAVYVVVLREVDGDPVRYVERFSSRITADNFLDCAVEVSASTGATSITGLEHLAGEDVTLVLNGAEWGPFEVSEAGTVALGRTLGEDVTGMAGLAYLPELEPLDIVHPKQDVRGQQKIVKAVQLDVVASKGLWVGADAEHMDEWKQRTVADSYGPVNAYTGVVRVNTSGGSNTGGRVLIQQRSPFPLAIHGLGREVAFGGE